MHFDKFDVCFKFACFQHLLQIFKKKVIRFFVIAQTTMSKRQAPTHADSRADSCVDNKKRCVQPSVKFPKLNHARFCANNCRLENTMASSPRVFAFMAANPGVKPCAVPISLEDRMFAWKCGECAHRFHMTCANVHRGVWCPFCTQEGLGGSNHCQLCFNKTLASHYRAMSFLAANRSLNLLAVPLTSTSTYQWLCFECDEVFSAACNDVTGAGAWCPSCLR